MGSTETVVLLGFLSAVTLASLMTLSCCQMHDAHIHNHIMLHIKNGVSFIILLAF